MSSRTETDRVVNDGGFHDYAFVIDGEDADEAETDILSPYSFDDDFDATADYELPEAEPEVAPKTTPHLPAFDDVPFSDHDLSTEEAIDAYTANVSQTVIENQKNKHKPSSIDDTIKRMVEDTQTPNKVTIGDALNQQMKDVRLSKSSDSVELAAIPESEAYQVDVTGPVIEGGVHHVKDRSLWLAALFDQRVWDMIHGDMIDEFQWDSNKLVIDAANLILVENAGFEPPNWTTVDIENLFMPMLTTGVMNLEAFIRKVEHLRKSPDEVALRIVDEMHNHHKKAVFAELYENTINYDISLLPEFIRGVKDMPTTYINDGKLEPVRMDSDEFQKLLAKDIETTTTAVPSSLELVQKNTPLSGYQRGSVTLISAPPGCGKSALSLKEALYAANYGDDVTGDPEDNQEVFLAVLADLTYTDICARIISMKDRRELAEVMMTIDSDVKRPRFKKWVKNITLFLANPGQISISDLDSKIKKRDDAGIKTDLVVVDYDSNFKEAMDDAENLYHTGGIIYTGLAKIAKPSNQQNKAVIVLAQPAKWAWKDEAISMESISESAKKVHVSDMIITLGKNAKNMDYNCGMMSIVKNRRGKQGYQPWSMSPHGEIDNISVTDYALIKVHS